MKAQLSAEMIILVAVVLAVVAIVAVTLIHIGEKTSGNVTEQSDKILNKAKNITDDLSKASFEPVIMLSEKSTQ